MGGGPRKKRGEPPGVAYLGEYPRPPRYAQRGVLGRARFVRCSVPIEDDDDLEVWSPEEPEGWFPEDDEDEDDEWTDDDDGAEDV